MLPAKMFLLGATALAVASAQNQPLLPQGAVTHVSDHVYAIEGWPNVGIIVGERATLVVDTGMGPRNGATVMREVEKLAKGPKLYLTTTHFHPEHASGASAFPPGAILIRPDDFVAWRSPGPVEQAEERLGQVFACLLYR